MRYKLLFGLIIITMILSTGCMNTTDNTKKIVNNIVQPTVEPPNSMGKSALSVNQLPIPTQQETIINSSPITPSSTLVYGEFSTRGDSIWFKNKSNITIIVTVLPTPIPTITTVATTIVPTQTTPTFTHVPTTIIPTTTRSPTPTPTLTPFPTPIPGETFGAIASNPTGSPLGGGSGYNKMVLKSDAKYIVSTKQELLDAFKVAKHGEIVFVNGDAVIDMTGTNNNIIPAGIILASDRGQGGSQGGLIKRYRSSGITWSQTPCFVITGNNVRVTGLRLDGGEIVRDQLTDQLNPPIMPLAMFSARGASGFEVDNNEMYGFSYTAIELENTGYWNKNVGNAWVHHNYIHHCQARGYGYGICLNDGTVLIEANIFDYMRHAVAAEGFPGESYEFRYNHHLGHGYPIGASVCDVHAYPPGDYEDENSIAGYEYKIHHNTFERPERPDMSDNPAIGIRAKPEKTVYIDHNIFNYNSDSGYPTPVFLRACNINGAMTMTRNYVGYDGEIPKFVAGDIVSYNISKPNSCG